MHQGNGKWRVSPSRNLTFMAHHSMGSTHSGKNNSAIRIQLYSSRRQRNRDAAKAKAAKATEEAAAAKKAKQERLEDIYATLHYLVIFIVILISIIVLSR